MILVGDIGNTETKICLVAPNKKIIKKIIFNTKNINNSLLRKSFKKLNLRNSDIEKNLFCSVVPKAFLLIKKYLKKFYNFNCYEIKDLKISNLIKIKVSKKQIGSDRLANAISVMNNKDNFIILDFGTATTFDVLIKNIYHGGVIAPGLNLSLNTLINKASLIPNLSLKKMKNVIGLNTINAVRAGFFWGYRGLIDNIITLIKKETKKSFKIIITGGFSHLFTKSINTKVVVDKDITIKGLIKIADLIK